MQEKDPLFGFYEQTMKNYVEEKPLQVGDELMLYGGQYNQHQYLIVKVEKTNHTKQHRIIVSDALSWGGSSFYPTGISCFNPKGQTRLIPVIPWVKKQMDSNNSVTFDSKWKKIQ